MRWDDVCAVAGSYPNVVAGTYHGYPALRRNGRFLLRLSDDHASLEFKSIDPGEREMMLATQPEVFHLPEEFRGTGVFVRLGALDERTLRRLIEQRLLATAAKRTRP